jgi:hypothetical protein
MHDVLCTPHMNHNPRIDNQLNIARAETIILLAKFGVRICRMRFMLFQDFSYALLVVGGTVYLRGWGGVL